MDKSLKVILSISISVIVAGFAGIIGGFFTSMSVSGWYLTLSKPFFNPPAWVFAPTWTFLFVLMGIASYFVFINGIEKKEVKVALSIYGVQLIFNVLWSVFFFGLKSPLLGFINILILWGLILITIILFWRIDKKAGYLMIPYILWVSFAAVLNFAILILN